MKYIIERNGNGKFRAKYFTGESWRYLPDDPLSLWPRPKEFPSMTRALDALQIEKEERIREAKASEWTVQWKGDI